MFSLQEVINLNDLPSTALPPDKDYIERYRMVSGCGETGCDTDGGLIFIVKRVELVFYSQPCQVICFTDITSYKLLHQKEEKNRLLVSLNTTVHHEMLAPLKANMDISMYLFHNITVKRLKKMSELIYITSKIIFLHA